MPNYLRGTEKPVPHHLPERALHITKSTLYHQNNDIPYYSKFTIVIYINDVRRNAGAVQVNCGEE